MMLTFEREFRSRSRSRLQAFTDRIVVVTSRQ